MNLSQMGKANLPNNEAERLKALRSYHILDTLPEEEYDDITLMAAHACQMPIALISLVDECRQWFKSRQGFTATQTPLDIAFCSHAILNPNEPLIVEDAIKDSRFARNPLVTDVPNIRFYAGMPITGEDNLAIGTLCVMDHKPRQLSPEQIEYLRLLTQSVNRRFKERKQNFKRQADLDSFNCAVNTASIVSQTDKKGKITYVNSKFIEVAGFSKAELLGQDHRLLNSGHHPKAFFVDLWKTISAGNTWRGEVKNKAKNGTYYWVDSVITPIKDNAGNIEGYLSVRNLVTERKNAERLVRESEERFSTLVKSTSNIIWVMDEKGEPVGNMETWTKFTGQSYEEVKYGGWANAIHPKDRERVQNVVGEAISELTPFHIENRIRRHDGEWMWMEVSAVPVFNADGTLREWIGSANDINQRKVAEELTRNAETRYRMLFEQSPDGIVIYDDGLRPVSFNPKAHIHLGYSKEEFSQLQISDYEAILTVEEIKTLVVKILKEDKLDFETKQRKKNGDLIDVHVTVRKFILQGKQMFYAVFRDITESKKAEDLIRISTKNLIEAQRIARLGSWEMDHETDRLTWSDETFRIFETDPATTKPVYEVYQATLHPDDREMIKKAFDDSVKNKSPYRLEHRLKFKDGRIKYVEEQGEAFIDENGNPLKSIGTIQDITERKKSELRLQETKQKFQRVVNNINDGLLIDDLEGKVVFGNKRLLEMFGLTEKSLTNLTIEDYVAPEHRALLRERHTRRIAGEEVSEIFEFKGLLKDGTRRWFEARVSKVIENGKIKGTQSAIRDITERKKSDLELHENQQKFQRVVENINDGLLIDDLEGRVVFGNNRLLEMFGLTENDLTNLTLEDYVAPEYQAILRDRHNRRIAGEEVPEVFEYEGLLKDGTRRWLEVRVSKVFENGKIIGTQSVIRDITERKKEHLLLNRVNQVVSVKTGAGYFSELTAFLTSQLNVKYAFVGKYHPEKDSVETISFRCDEMEQPNFTYPLAGTPCENVIKETTCAYPSNVQSLFPDDEDLKTLNIESYLGMQLHDENNQPLGIIVLLDEKPFDDAEEKEKIISIAALRTVNEIKQRDVLNQLKESEEKYRNLFQKMNEGLVQTSPIGIIQLVNPRYAELTGYSEEELMGQNIYELFNTEKCAFSIGKIKQGDAPVSEHYEEEYITKAGDAIWVSISDSPQYNQNGKLVGVSFIVSDVTERKRAEEKIIQSKQLLQDLTDQVPGAVYQFQMYPDGRMHFPYFSKGIAKLCPGLTPECIKKNAALIFESIHPKDLPMVQTSVMWSNKKLENFSLQYRNVLPDGQIRWHAINSVPQRQPDGSVLWHGLFADITEEKLMQQKAEEASKNLQQQYSQILELQERYAGILHNTSDLIHSVDGQGNLCFVNQAWLRKLGYATEDEVVGKSVFEFIHPECVPPCKQIFARMLNGEQIRFAETSFITATGNKIDCEAAIHINFENGKLKNTECFFRDVTELKKERVEKEKMQQNALAILEEKVKERTAELQDVNKELEAFSYTVSHDLQSPLRSISGFSTIIKRKYNDLLDEQGKEFLGFIDSSAKQMSQLIQDLLHFSRLGKTPVTKREVDMDKLVCLAIDEIKSSHNSLKTKFNLHPLRSTPCDFVLMRQVWTNLIGNAVKYSSKKENPVVEVGMKDINGEVVYFVKDNGDGFDMKQADRIFGVFQRLHLANEFEGTGVGLATVKRIITKHGGRIWAKGEKDRGLCFILLYPPKLWIKKFSAVGPPHTLAYTQMSSYFKKKPRKHF